MKNRKNWEIIKILRKSKNMTQMELLADSFCTPRQLSRIENGECDPHKDTFTHLLMIMGEDASEYSYDNYSNKKDEEAYSIVSEIETLIFELRYDEAKAKFDALNKLHIFNVKNRFNSQIWLHFEMIFLLMIDGDKESALLKAYEAIRVIIRDFNVDSIEKYWLTDQEYYILNTMAMIHIALNEVELGISILSKLMERLKKIQIPQTLKSQLLPLICCSLSKHLGLQNRFEETLAICNEGISICQSNYSTKYLGDLLYNKAYSFYYLNDLAEAQVNFTRSYYAFDFAGDSQMAAIVKENAKNKYGILIKLFNHPDSVNHRPFGNFL